MDVLTAIARLEALLMDEREAIREIDAERVALLASEKELLFSVIQQGITDDKEHSHAMRGLVEQLRHNAILLAHARDCMRDAITTIQTEVLHDGFMSPTAPVFRPGIRVSVTG